MIDVAFALMMMTPAASAMARKPKAEPTPMETGGQYSPVKEPGQRVIKTEAEWSKLWQQLGKDPSPPTLGDSFAVAVFAGERSTGGYKIVFDEPKEEKGALVVRYAVVKPKGMVTMSFTHPYAIKLFPKTDKPVKVEGGER